MSGYSIPTIWSRRSSLDVAVEHLVVAEIRDAGADGAGGGGVARFCGDPVPDQRNQVEYARGERAAGVSGLYRSGVPEPQILGAGLRYDQGGKPRRKGSIRELTLVLNLFVAACRLDRIVIRRREFGVPERQICIAQKRLPRARRARIRPDFVDLEQDRHKTEQRHRRLRHLRQRPVFLPPQDARLRHQGYSAATKWSGSSIPTSSISALCE